MAAAIIPANKRALRAVEMARPLNPAKTSLQVMVHLLPKDAKEAGSVLLAMELEEGVVASWEPMIILIVIAIAKIQENAGVVKERVN
jgi:hypothetical protein